MYAPNPASCAALVLVALTWAALGQEAKKPDADEAVVRKHAFTLMSLFSLDAPVRLERAAALLADDVDYVWANGKAGKGKAAYLKLAAENLKSLKARFRSLSVRFHARSIRLFAGGACVHGSAALDGRLRAGNRPARYTMWMTFVFRKTPAGYRLIAEHSSPKTTPEPTTF